LLAGGIAFDTPDIDQPGEPAAAGTTFRCSRASAR
jgi:paraquat-inducible protein B